MVTSIFMLDFLLNTDLGLLSLSYLYLCQVFFLEQLALNLAFDPLLFLLWHLFLCCYHGYHDHLQNQNQNHFLPNSDLVFIYTFHMMFNHLISLLRVICPILIYINLYTSPSGHQHIQQTLQFFLFLQFWSGFLALMACHHCHFSKSS